MANIERGFVAIDLDKPRRVLLDFTAMAELEAFTGKTVSELFSTNGQYGFDILRKLLWAGLIHEDKRLEKNPQEGVRVAGKLIDFAPGDSFFEKISYVSKKISEAIALSWGTEKKDVAAGVLAKVEGPGVGVPPSDSPMALSA